MFVIRNLVCFLGEVFLRFFLEGILLVVCCVFLVGVLGRCVYLLRESGRFFLSFCFFVFLWFLF